MDEFLRLSGDAFRTVHGRPGPDSGPRGGPLPEGLAAWARRHRMTGLLAAGTPNVGAELAAPAQGKAQHSARLAYEAGRLYGLLSHALPALALVKGPALAVQAWPDSGLRSFDDIDFLCGHRDYPNLMDGLSSAGCEPETADPRHRWLLWHYGWGISFRHPEGFLVEVNHRFFPPHYPWPRGLDARRSAAFAELALDGAPVRAPAPALHLLQSTLHAVWHGWARLAWIADIAGLLVRHPEAFAQAGNLAEGRPFAQRALAAGCGVANAIFGPGLCTTTTPQPIMDEAIALLAGNARSLSGSELRALHEQFMTRAEIAAYRLRRILTPGDGDFRWIALPPALRGLYWPLRPLRAMVSGTSSP